jgi:hypothetical protein
VCADANFNWEISGTPGDDYTVDFYGKIICDGGQPNWSHYVYGEDANLGTVGYWSEGYYMTTSFSLSNGEHSAYAQAHLANSGTGNGPTNNSSTNYFTVQ